MSPVQPFCIRTPPKEGGVRYSATMYSGTSKGGWCPLFGHYVVGHLQREGGSTIRPLCFRTPTKEDGVPYSAPTLNNVSNTSPMCHMFNSRRKMPLFAHHLFKSIRTLKCQGRALFGSYMSMDTGTQNEHPIQP